MSHLTLAGVARSFLAIFAGFATMAVLVAAATAVLIKLAPGFVGEQTHPQRPYIVVNLAYSALFAAAGGFVTAAIAGPDALRHVLILAIAILLFSALSALQLRGRQPLVYQFLLIVLMPLAIVGGGLLRLHQAGYRW